MRICKDRTTGSQAIHVWRLNLRMPAEWTNPVIEIIDRNEQHVRFRIR